MWPNHKKWSLPIKSLMGKLHFLCSEDKKGLKELCTNNIWDIVIVLHNLTNKF